MRRELIYIDGIDQTDKIEKYSVTENGCLIIFKNNKKEFHYGKKRVRITQSALSNYKSLNIFNYLKEISTVVGLKSEEGENILETCYNNIDAISEDSALAHLLNQSIPLRNFKPTDSLIFPFGFNLSQRAAVMKAFTINISVIEGPPGTGKTQTILNIIANAILQGKTVAVVSGNNSATNNIYEKLEKINLEFIAARLGNSHNKKEFIDTQKELPNLSSFYLNQSQKKELKANAEKQLQVLCEKMELKNELASIMVEIENLNTEYGHFKQSANISTLKKFKFLRKIKAKKLSRLLTKLETWALKQKKIGIANKLTLFIQYGVNDKLFYKSPFSEIITICQIAYYEALILSLKNKAKALNADLANFAFDVKMKDYTESAMQLLKASLFDHYSQKKRATYTQADLRYKSQDFIKDYPIIMSTTHSLRNSLSEKLAYDYVIIDESSQVDLATGALALSCAKNTVIVGDTRQLPHVVDKDTQIKTDGIFDSYQLNKAYRYSTNSLLSTVIELSPKTPRTFLKEHYRCHPKIIEFCNKKFYDNQLIIHTESSSNRQPLLVYKTTTGNHARERMNQRQIDTIQREIIPNEKLENENLGIVTPYRNQSNALQRTFWGTSIKADTVDKFQGRENDIIILSTVDNEITDFSDNPNRLNVAISRAIKQLILVVNGNDNETDNNIHDLIKYIEYNNFTITKSKLSSVFDLLYKGYEKERLKAIYNSGRVSKYDSENLMFGLIKSILKEDLYLKYDVVIHYPLNQLVWDYSVLADTEAKYASNNWSHLDFLIFNRVTKHPVLAIEVDGYEYHKSGTKQAERDNIKNAILQKLALPLLRFRTNESNEKNKLRTKLQEIQITN